MYRRLAVVVILACLVGSSASNPVSAAPQVYVDARPALGILAAGARITNPQVLQAELTLQNGVKLWFAVRANPIQRVAPSPGSSLPNYLSTFYLLAPQSEVKFLGTFPEPGDRVTLVATINSLDAALLNIEQALVTGALAMVPGTGGVAPRSLVEALQAFKDINAIRQAAMAFIPPPKTKAQWAKASLRAIDSLRVLLRDEKQAALLVQAFRRLGLSISSEQVKKLLLADNLRGLLKIIADEAVFVYVTKGKEPTVIFERSSPPVPTATARPVTVGEATVSPHATSQGIYAWNYREQALMLYSQSGRWERTSEGFWGGVDEVIWSPDGSKALLRVTNNLHLRDEVIRSSPLLRASSPHEAKLTWLWTRERGIPKFVSDQILWAAWTKDGSNIVYVRRPTPWTRIWLSKPDGTSPVLLGTASTHRAGHVLFADRTTTVFLGSDPTSIDVLQRLRGGRITELAQVHGRPAVNSSGDSVAAYVAYVVDAGEGLYVIDINTTKRHRVQEISVRETFRYPEVAWSTDGSLVVMEYKRNRVLLWRFPPSSGSPRRKELLGIRLPRSKPVTVIVSTDNRFVYLLSDNTLYRTEIP